MGNQQFEREKQMSFGAKVAVIGFFGGVFWSLIGYFSFYFNFIRVGPALVLMPFSLALGSWKDTYVGQLIGILIIAVLSIGVAFLYKMLLQKLPQIWVGFGFGFVLWIIVFYLINPLLPGLKSIQNLDSNTIVTSICLYVLYGTFLGYSISFEYSQQHNDT